MIRRFLRSLRNAFGCPHDRLSFPLTHMGGRRSEAAAVTGVYVVCTDCGKEFPYDWGRMRVIWNYRGKIIPEPAGQRMVKELKGEPEKVTRIDDRRRRETWLGIRKT